MARIIYGYRYYSTELGRWISRDPISEEGGINLYLYSNNCAVNYIDVLGENTYFSEDVRVLLSEVGRYIVDAVSERLYNVSINVLTELKEISIKAASKAINEGGYSFGYRAEWDSKKFQSIKYNLNFHVNAKRVSRPGLVIVDTSKEQGCCSEVVIGGGGGGRFKTPVPILLGSTPVVGFSSSLDFCAVVCVEGKEFQTFVFESITGRYVINAAGGPRWGKEYEKFGVNVSAFFEVGFKGNYRFDFGTLQGELDYGLYARAVADIQFPGTEKRRMQKSWNADDLAW